MPEKEDKNQYSRSDLACERRRVESDSENAEQSDRICRGFHISELVISGDGDYPSGRYVTVNTGKIWMEGDDRIEDCIQVLADELSTFVENHTRGKSPSELCIMIAGLGNRFITADSLGPLTVDKLTVTKHVMGNGGIFDSLGCAGLCAVQPGVLGQTGIEAAEIIAGAVRAADPDVVIAVDALAARSMERLATTVQLSDGGICPGSGIGNKRVAINKESIGCPVIAVGVPTVVDSSTLVWDALEKAGIGEVDPSLHQVLENGKSFFVSPKESDIITEEISSLLADTICRMAGI